MILAQIAEFQAALSDPQVQGVIVHFGLQVTDLLTLCGLTYCTVALIKKHTNLPGWGYLLSCVGSSLAWCILWYLAPIMPLWAKATILVTVITSGGWQAGKDIIGKIKIGGTGVPPPEIKPAGEFNRGPSTVVNVTPGGA